MPARVTHQRLFIAGQAKQRFACCGQPELFGEQLRASRALPRPCKMCCPSASFRLRNSKSALKGLRFSAQRRPAWTDSSVCVQAGENKSFALVERKHSPTAANLPASSEGCAALCGRSTRSFPSPPLPPNRESKEPPFQLVQTVATATSLVLASSG